ncbi:MAG: glycyl-radical enzyme activating protein [Candidatus Lernaella stagnicola]|nr:glycyl-radical enzyme activating protein [Candidatus Lernaella stagnicola]
MTTTPDGTLSATVLEIQRMSTEDGPGIRTTVFFKGCTLACTWCHNPESLDTRPQIQWVDSRCIGCRLCVEVCPVGALSFDEGVRIDREKCTACGTCVEECPSTAMELLGRRWSVDDLVAEVIKDKTYYETSGGGITASGGEATMQAPFVAEFMRRLREAGVTTALDTCGQTSWGNLEAILPHTDILLYDLKLMDDEAHRTFTSHTGERPRDNLRRVAAYRRTHETPHTLWIRTPIIPGATDAPANIRAIGEFIAAELDGVVQRWELCSFNNLCRDKYLRLGMVWDFHEAELIPKATMESLAAVAADSGVDPSIVHWSGVTRLEEDAANGEEQTKVRKIDCC